MKAVTYTINRDIKDLACTIKTILNNIESQQLISEKTIFELKVVLNELIVNAICHGNLCQESKGTQVTIKIVNNNLLYLSVKDEGCGFKHNDLLRLSEIIEQNNNTYSEHGRGLLIVEQLCEKIRFNSCGNKVSIIKSLK